MRKRNHFSFKMIISLKRNLVTKPQMNIIVYCNKNYTHKHSPIIRIYQTIIN